MIITFILLLVIVLTGYQIWWPRYKQMRGMREMDRKEDTEILDDLEE